MKNIFYILFVLLLCISCEKQEVEKEFLLKVRDSKVTCVGAHGPMECLQVQKGNLLGTQQWEYFYDPIEGFTYQPGYLYTLKVRSRPVKNPPADASSIKYKLVEVVSKEEV